jgi:hypothetical protein
MNERWSPQEFIYPQEAERIWASLPRPTPRKVALEMWEDGRYVSPDMIDFWQSRGWKGEPFPRLTHLPAFEDLFADEPDSATTALRDAVVDRRLMDGFGDMSDDALMRLCAREIQAMLIVTSRAIRARKTKLVTEKPKELGALIKAIGEATETVHASYNQVLTLRERSMKMIENNQEQPSTETPVPDDDPLKGQLQQWSTHAKAITRPAV